MNKLGFLAGYLAKAAFQQAGGPIWTGYTAETPTTTATDNEKENKDDQIYNEGTPWGIKDYAGGGEAGVIGLAKGAEIKTASAGTVPMVQTAQKEKKKVSASGFPGDKEGIGARTNIDVDFAAQNKAGGTGTRKDLWDSTMKENKDAV